MGPVVSCPCLWPCSAQTTRCHMEKGHSIPGATTRAHGGRKCILRKNSDLGDSEMPVTAATQVERGLIRSTLKDSPSSEVCDKENTWEAGTYWHRSHAQMPGMP